MLALSVTALAHDDRSELLEELIVYGRAEPLLDVAESASEGLVGYDDIRLPPLLRVGELVEAVPGMVATQHSGTGKANQYFLRGFNLDHGTDFSAFLNGVPLNLRTHGHGQGYLDLNFLIPELVARTAYRKGPYSAGLGDFSSAGSLSFDYYDRLEESLVDVTVGEYDYVRGLAAGSTDMGSGVVTGALAVERYRGPWDLDEDLRASRFYLAHTGSVAGLDSRVSLSGYRGAWGSTDQVPARAVASGLIAPRGFIDPTLGGQTDRHELTASLAGDSWRATGYVVDYDFTLFSNFTYLLDDPESGDQFEQRDRRTVYGARVDGNVDIAQRVDMRWGGDLRIDDIGEVGLYRTVARERRSTVRKDDVTLSSVSAYGDLAVSISERLRAAVGVRADVYDWNVRAQRSANSGSGSDALLSPKVNLAWRMSDSTALYANWGRSFHSNDVRGATIAIDPGSGTPAQRVDALSRSNGAELGLRFERDEAFNATLTAFWLELDSELVFVGDAGGTEATGASRRLGLEFASFWQPLPWLAANLALTRTDAEFLQDAGAGRKIPGAVESTAMLGLNASLDGGAFASLRLRYLGEAPLVEDNSVRAPSSLLVNAGVGYRLGSTEIRVEVFNLFDSGDNDIAYFYASRLPGEPADGIEDIHAHSLEPRALRASLAMYFR